MSDSYKLGSTSAVSNLEDDPLRCVIVVKAS